MNAESLPSCLVAGFSMQPLLQNGDRVFLQPVKHCELLPGDVIVFQRGGRNIVHRVIRTGDVIQTQGDANPLPDEPLMPETETSLCLSFEHGNVRTPLKRGDRGLAEFRRNQRLRKRRELLLKIARFLCRIAPFKLRAEELEQAEFDSLRVFYWRKHPVACEQNGEWRWNRIRYACFIKRAHRQKLRENERKEILFAETLFRLLGEMVFGDPRKFFSEQSPEMQEELCRRGRMQALSPIFYYLLTDLLPQTWFPVFKQDFYAQAHFDFFYSDALKKIYGEFSSLGTPFIPLKGSFFAYEVYPHPALRLRRDQDILLRRSEAEKVFRHLQESGWNSKEQRHPFFKRLHLPTLIREGRPALELHWHILKNRLFFDPETLWSEASVPIPGEPLRRNLCPEAHYLLTVYNLYFDRWQFACRSLLDLAFLQKKYRPDPERIAELNRKWNLNLDLGLCYRLFPSMFPEEQRLFPSVTAVPDRARFAVYRLSLTEYPEAVVPFLSRSGGPLPAIPEKRKRRGIFRRARRRTPETEKALRLLERLLPGAMELKQNYRKNKDK